MQAARKLDWLRVRQGPPVYIVCSVTVTEGVKKGTYGGCQCRSARQTDRRPQQAPGSQHWQNLFERAALLAGQPATHIPQWWHCRYGTTCLQKQSQRSTLAEVKWVICLLIKCVVSSLQGVQRMQHRRDTLLKQFLLWHPGYGLKSTSTVQRGNETSACKAASLILQIRAKSDLGSLCTNNEAWLFVSLSCTLL